MSRTFFPAPIGPYPHGPPMPPASSRRRVPVALLIGGVAMVVLVAAALVLWVGRAKADRAYPFPEHHFTITLPGSWRSMPPTEKEILLKVMPDGPRRATQHPDFLFVSVFGGPANRMDEAVIDAAVAGGLRYSKGQGEENFSTVGDATLDGHPAKTYSSTKVIDGQEVTMLRIVSIRKTWGYIIRYHCDTARLAEGRKQFDRALAGFKWVD